MLNYKKIIFVSTENTCLSPMAEIILKQELKESGIEVQSRGLVVLFQEPPNQKAAEVAKEKGYDLSEHVSISICEKDFGEDTLVLVMTKQNKQKIYEEYKESKNVYTIKEFVGEIGDIKAPYGGGIKEYEDSFENMERLIKKVTKRLSGEEDK